MQTNKIVCFLYHGYRCIVIFFHIVSTSISPSTTYMQAQSRTHKFLQVVKYIQVNQDCLV